jgi:pimeloyl-ACP methyl ester carboxylesterase
MTNTAGDSYRDSIPSDYVTAAGVEYYILAVDDLGVGNYHGTPDVPHVVSVSTNPPPDTKIETADIDSVNGTARFTWSGSDDTTPATELTYSYRLVRPGPAYDNWSSWSSGKTKKYTALSPGNYKFQVRARDAEQVIDPSPASRDFLIEEVIPAQVPVIIIPGLMGSYLEDGNDMVWNPDAEWWKPGQHDLFELDDPGHLLTSSDISHNYYASLWDALRGWGYSEPVRLEYPFSTTQSWEANRDLFLFCYDWRQDLTAIAVNLKYAIQWILNHSSGSQVDLIAHSMGGLVTRTYVNLSSGYAANIRKLIFLGVPNHGSPSAYLALHPDFGCYKPSRCYKFLAQRLKNLPGLYQLLPTPKSFRDLYSYMFVDNWSYTAPGVPSNSAEGALNSWDATYVENPDSRLANQELVSLAKQRHENTLGESLKFDGELYLFVGTNLETPLYVAKEGQILYTSPPDSSTPAISDTHWDIFFGDGDGRVLTKSAATLSVDSNDPKSCILTLREADHAGELVSSTETLQAIRAILGQPYSEKLLRQLDAQTNTPAILEPQYRKIRRCSPAELRVYDSEGTLVAGLDGDTVVTTKETTFYVLGETEIATIPLTGNYRIEVEGTGSGTLTLELSTCEGATTTELYRFWNVPIQKGSLGEVSFDSQDVSPPPLKMDANGDGTIDQSIMSEPGNTPLGSSATLSFYNGLVSLVLGEITSAGHTVCGSVDSLEGLSPSFHPATPFYWLTTSARFSDPVSIAIQYDEDNVPTGRESDLKLYKITGETIEDITQKLDQAANTVTGQTDGFSYFVVGYMNASPETSILSPTTGDTVTAQSCSIQWQTTDPDTPASSLSIDLSYSTDNGTTWTSISSNETNDGAYDWDISALHGGEYWLKLVAEDPDGASTEATVGPFTIVTLAGNVIVGPNPVTGAGTAFFYTLPEDASNARLMIYGVSGRLLFETPLDADSTRFPSAGTWNPVDQDGTPLANGPYVYVLIADGKVIGQGKMLIQR